MTVQTMPMPGPSGRRPPTGPGPVPRAVAPPAGTPGTGLAIPPAAVRSPVDVEIVIPAFNESRRLPTTLAAMVAHLSGGAAGAGRTCRVVVVDNGSSDDTVAAAQAAAADGVEVVAIGCALPGKGAAVLRGLRTSSARFVGFTDADLSTPLDTLGPALEALADGAAAAIASRHAPGAQLAVPQSLGRRVGGTVFRTMARQIVHGVSDTQCGFKFFDRVAVQAALEHCRSTGFAFDVELLGQIQAAGGRIAEIPVTWTDDPGSSLRPIRDGVSAVVALTRVRRRVRAAAAVLAARAVDGGPAEPFGELDADLDGFLELAPQEAIAAILDLTPAADVAELLASVGPVVEIGPGGLVVPVADVPPPLAGVLLEAIPAQRVEQPVPPTTPDPDLPLRATR